MRVKLSQFFLLLTLLTVAAHAFAAEPSPTRPNVLWISLEDLSPDIGCYGDKYATTPVLDKFATESVRYTRCFTHAGVCAPSRSGLITGMYPPSITTQHMRCDGVPPPYVRCFTEHLRAAGYFCTNNSKTDYQFTPPITAWDENGNKAHWKNRGKDAHGKDQPFFAVFNLVSTHESQIRTAGAIGRKLPADKKHDPAKAVLPPYYPDTPLVRQDWANYYDNLTATEDRIAELLKELDDAGLREETIVWFWGDHGRGLPRAKRWLYDSGVRAPLMIRIPEKWRKLAAPREGIAVMPGSVDEELHAFVDFAPTMLSLCGLNVPTSLQGQAFLGPQASTKPREYVFGHRDRMDERYDMIRMARDKRYKYIRNFRPDLPYAQHINYMDEMPTMQEWRRLAAEGKLNDQQKIFFAPYKPLEELYDTENDPHELVNLSDQPAQLEKLLELRRACFGWMSQIGDTGMLPEGMIETWNHPNGKTPQAPQPCFKVHFQDDKQVSLGLFCPGDGTLLYDTLSAKDFEAWQKKINDGPRNASLKQLSTQGVQVTLPADQVLVARSVRLGHRNSEFLVWRAGDPVPTEPEPAVASKVMQTQAMVKVVLYELEPYLLTDGTWTNPKAAVHSARINEMVEHFAGMGPQMKKMAEQMQKGSGLDQACQDAVLIQYLLPLMKVARRNSVNFKQPNLPPIHELPVKYGLKLVWYATFVESEQEVQELQKMALETLKNDPNEFYRLQAAQVLDDLGEAARPALAEIETASKKDDYPGRVCKFIVKKLRK